MSNVKLIGKNGKTSVDSVKELRHDLREAVFKHEDRMLLATAVGVMQVVMQELVAAHIEDVSNPE